MNEKQKIGLLYYEPLLERIPRDEILQYKQHFSAIFDELINTTDINSFEIVGSFRRGATDSGDIDIIVTGETSIPFNNFLNYLETNNIIVESLSRGNAKSLTIAKLNNTSIPRRVDFLYSSIEEYPFAVLYFTGSKYFNTAMRLHALNMNYTLNEHGLYNIKKQDKKIIKYSKVLFPFSCEKDIFEFLNIQYVEPQNRIDASSVVLLPKKIKLKIKAPDFIESFRKLGLHHLETLTVEALNAIIISANNTYYNTPTRQFLTDSEYDTITDYVKTTYGDTAATAQIGAPIITKNKVTLPYQMPSMDKIKSDPQLLTNWKDKYAGPYIISAKADGVSALYTTENNTPRLLTRGNGVEGQDVSHIIPYLNLPQAIVRDDGTLTPLTVRGELIMQESVFKDKYHDKFANPRNLVAGIVNMQTQNPERYRDIDFLIYEVICPVNATPHAQLSAALDTVCAAESQHTMIRHDVIADYADLTMENLSEKLQNWRSTYGYEIDGLIVADNRIYERTLNNPKHAFAFKMILTDQIAESTVLDVIWNPSKDGYLKPKIVIVPVHIGGVEISCATAFNGAYVRKHRLGVGAVVQIIRSGDVIPHIQNVLQPALETKMPSMPYNWTDTNIDVVLNDKDINEVVRAKQIAGFFKRLSVDGLGEGNVNRIVRFSGSEENPGLLPKQASIISVLNMSIQDFILVPGFKITMATKIYNSIRENIESVSLIKLIVATNIMGRGMGEKRIAQIMSAHPDIITDEGREEAENVAMIAAVHGMANKTAKLFASNISKIRAFLTETHLLDKLIVDETVGNTDSPLYNKKIVLSGFRDKTLVSSILDLHGIVDDSVTKATHCVVVKNIADLTEKTRLATQYNVEIVDAESFKTTYLS
jgi:NAD-dependent DNA ligase/predicted nucleotidyltransferase